MSRLPPPPRMPTGFDLRETLGLDFGVEPSAEERARSDRETRRPARGGAR